MWELSEGPVKVWGREGEEVEVEITSAPGWSLLMRMCEEGSLQKLRLRQTQTNI